MNWDEDTDRQPATNAARRNNFVMPALPSPTAIVRAEPTAVAGPGYMPTVNVPAPIVMVEDDGHFAIERAKGFAIKTSMLGGGFALAAAAVTLIVLLGRADGVLTGLIVLVVLFGTFAGVWLYALRQEVQTSAGGIARRHADGLWGFVEREQEHLHRMEIDRWNKQ